MESNKNKLREAFRRVGVTPKLIAIGLLGGAVLGMGIDVYKKYQTINEDGSRADAAAKVEGRALDRPVLPGPK